MMSSKTKFEILLATISIFMTQVDVIYGIDVEMNENFTGNVGEAGEINCSFSKENVKTIFTLRLFIRNKTTHAFVPIVTFLPGEATLFTSSGEYLRNRVTLTNVTQESTEATMIFKQLKCTDQNQYLCEVTYLTTHYTAAIDMSLPTTIKVKVLPKTPSISSSIKTTSPDNHNVEKKSTTARENLNVTSISRTTNLSDQELSKTHLTTPLMEGERLLREGDNITFACTGNIGRPPGNMTWQIIYTQDNISFDYVNEKTLQKPIPWKCSFNGTSYLSIQLSAVYFKAKIRCFVISQNGKRGQYVETEPLDIHYRVRHVSIRKLHDKQSFDSTIKNIKLTCNSDGNPEPRYTWYKRSDINAVLSTSNEYVIDNVIKNNSGIFVCEVHNSIGGKEYNASTSIEITIENTENRRPSSTNNFSTEVSTIVAVLCGILAVIVIFLVSWTYLTHKYRRNKKNNNSTKSNIQELNNYDTIDDISPYDKIGPLDQHPYQELDKIVIREDCKDENRSNIKNNDPTKSNDRATYSYDTIEVRTTYKMPGPLDHRPYDEKEDFEDENRKYLTVVSGIQEKEQENIIIFPSVHLYSNLQF